MANTALQQVKNIQADLILAQGFVTPNSERAEKASPFYKRFDALYRESAPSAFAKFYPDFGAEERYIVQTGMLLARDVTKACPVDASDFKALHAHSKLTNALKKLTAAMGSKEDEATLKAYDELLVGIRKVLDAYTGLPAKTNA